MSALETFCGFGADNHSLCKRPKMETILATVPGGDIRGSTDGKIARFLGVPYAAPPGGARRFALPAPVEAWKGVRDATVAGPMPPQTRTPLPGLDVDLLLGPPWKPGSDDYLTLNIWKPDDARSGCPVMVWIHGGGFISGSKDVVIADGASFARDRIVCVAINYRLGIEGFLPIPGIPTNLGLRDQIAALAWVRDNIGRFGGDPDNVTVFGESAGAVSISCLIASPLAQGLFKRAIVQSGHGLFRRDVATAQRVVRRLAKYLKITPDVAGFRTVSAEDGLKAQDRVLAASIDLRNDQGVEAAFGISRFLPVHGDDVLPQRLDEALRSGLGADVDMLIGANSDEMNLFTVASGVKDKVSGLVATYVLNRSFPHARRILKAYGLGRKGVSPGQALTDATTDLVFREPVRRFAEAHQGRTHLYEFGWRSPAFGGQLGAAHAVEIPFVFDTLKGTADLLGENPPQALANTIHRLWIGYATDGSLPWPEFEAQSRQLYRLDTGSVAKAAPLAAAAYLP